MQWTDDLRIETPEQIDVSLELAGLGSRFVARLIDWGVVLGLLAVIGFLGVIVATLLGGSVAQNTFGAYVLALVVALFYFCFLGYDIYFEVLQNGQTPGKKRAGIRVMRQTGAPVDFRSACIRNLLGMADFLPFFYLLGGLIVLLSPRRQRLGDLAAGTIVVRERAQSVPVDLSSEIERFASTEFAFTADQLASCSTDSRHILRSFFLRYRELEPHARDQLAHRLAHEFQRKTGYVVNTSPGAKPRPEVFLASLYRDLDSLKQHGR